MGGVLRVPLALALFRGGEERPELAGFSRSPILSSLSLQPILGGRGTIFVQIGVRSSSAPLPLSPPLSPSPLSPSPLPRLRI